MTEATEAPRGPDHHVRNRILLIVVGSVAVAAVAAGLIVAGIHGAKPGGPVPNALQPVATQQAAPSDSPASSGSSAKPTPGTKSETPAERTDAVKYGQQVAASVSTKQEAKTPAGLTAAVTTFASYTATATRAGEVSGPAVKATLTLTNGTGSSVPLTAVTVNGYYGDDATPASRVDGDKATKPFAAELAPGATATATYVFTVPADAKSVTITLADAAGAKLVTFTGAP
ncbi:hypothetical protein ASE16_18670 [Leifsonia sp. Root227]|jgi:hypothetical protein|uniref:hypothetical protein n=1 Tax=unclassified Leifsonia TaxID=2663824 RepID=UPI0006F87B9A|nr:hypothetical protein [Leifsonia sp. Root227]KRC47329.1 hypothetical protein ASE16_18670 [Leifsonia sp. Root227]